ncbi:hypothetical protein O0I10_002314 [Lichtheimia ornata]|uniref:Uncharacterized protein n=1 Tax=Lichtheimia ornata TaxID=688661 RepID=A0AAD7V9R3_9FUNG|nr:uncharacterized protein O0I10_002314 [Lichtheimia ornata]KAJ8661983.1 hypothetical protein O0I10_002314 [Lichtheimia ornata]
MHTNDCPAPAHHLHPSTFLIREDVIDQPSNKEVSFKAIRKSKLISSSSTPSSIVFHSQLLLIQVQLPPANNCTASAHHVAPAAVLK